MNIEKAAQKLADCMDYPWEFMSEQGRENMRNHVKAIIEAANSAPAEDVRAVVDEPLGWYYSGTDVGNVLSLFRLDHYYRRYNAESEHDYVKGEPLYSHPQRKVVMPERRDYDVGMRTSFGEGWNACLEEFERLNK